MGWMPLPEKLKFLSTPSARRATHQGTCVALSVKISIHALCEEGDLAVKNSCVHEAISIHALCEEGDPKEV